MDEFEQKLQLNNPVSIVQAITQLIATIKQKNLSGENKTVKHVSEYDLPELQILKVKCGDKNPLISLTASQGIIQLVEEGVLPAGATLSDLILILSTAKYI